MSSTSHHEQSAAASERPAAAPPVASARILVAEDDTLVRNVVVRILERAGFAVRSAHDGKEALAALEAGDVDLLVTDIVMPETEGIEMIMHVRRTHPALPILAISGEGLHGPDEFLGMARLLGAHRTLPKPFDPPRLVEIVREMLAPAA